MDISIEELEGSHREVAWSFREAEDSEQLLDTLHRPRPGLGLGHRGG